MKHTEQVVENHFFGEYGLEKELIAAGVMTPDTKVRSKVADADACCACSLFAHTTNKRRMTNNRAPPI